MQLRASLVTLALAAVPAFAASNQPLNQQFTQSVRPVIAKYCVGCHSGNSAAAQFDLSAYDSIDPVLRDYPRWELVLKRLNANEMPPKQAPQPPAEARHQIVAWIQTVRAEEIRKNASDPGVVLNRRLSNAEYNYTIRDLTGVDLRPANEFPVDPANQAGFDNSGESLEMSPGLMGKYLEAARQTADHLVLKPDGFAFAPWPMLVETDREHYTIQRIVDFYDRQPTDFADYFQAAWRYKHRVALGEPKATLASIAAENKLGPGTSPWSGSFWSRRKKWGQPSNCRRCGANCRPRKATSPILPAMPACRCGTMYAASAVTPRSYSIPPRRRARTPIPRRS